MNVKKLCRRENNASHEEDCCGICLSRIQYLPLSSLSGSAPSNVRWYSSLALGSLSKTTSNPQSVAVSFRFGWTPLFCPAGFPSSLGPVVVNLMTQEHCQHLLHLPPAGASGAIRNVGTLGHPWGHYSVFREDGGSVFSPLTTHLGLSQILSNNV